MHAVRRAVTEICRQRRVVEARDHWGHEHGDALLAHLDSVKQPGTQTVRIFKRAASTALPVTRGKYMGGSPALSLKTHVRLRPRGPRSGLPQIGKCLTDAKLELKASPGFEPGVEVWQIS
jgi:hypothetical protein